MPTVPRSEDFLWGEKGVVREGPVAGCVRCQIPPSTAVQVSVAAAQLPALCGLPVINAIVTVYLNGSKLGAAVQLKQGWRWLHMIAHFRENCDRMSARKNVLRMTVGRLEAGDMKGVKGKLSYTTRPPRRGVSHKVSGTGGTQAGRQ